MAVADALPADVAADYLRASGAGSKGTCTGPAAPHSQKSASVFSIFGAKISRPTAAVVVAKEWACTACSYLNTGKSASRKSCEICLTPRPAAAAVAGAAGRLSFSEAASQAVAAEEHDRLSFAVSEHAGRVHIFQPLANPQHAAEVGAEDRHESTVTVTIGGIMMRKLGNMHSLDLPAELLLNGEHL